MPIMTSRTHFCPRQNSQRAVCLEANILFRRCRRDPMMNISRSTAGRSLCSWRNFPADTSPGKRAGGASSTSARMGPPVMLGMFPMGPANTPRKLLESGRGREPGPYGITVNVVSPGAVQTGWLTRKRGRVHGQNLSAAENRDSGRYRLGGDLFRLPTSGLDHGPSALCRRRKPHVAPGCPARHIFFEFGIAPL